MCQDSNVDIVILAFLTEIAGPGGYPTVNFGAACGGSSSAQTAKGATGLLSCPTMAADITTCQGSGKKVMLSIGGASSDSAFTSVAQAQSFAAKVWNLFGSGTGEDSDLRPFGSTILDGIDIGKSHLVQMANTEYLLTIYIQTTKTTAQPTGATSSPPSAPQ